MTTPYIGFGNDTLSRQPIVHIGDIIICPNCSQEHTLCGDDNGGDLLLFYRCEDTSYLGAVNNRLIINVEADVSGNV